MYIHTVKGGDSIFSIAKAYAVPPMSIIENNELENPDALAPGQKLLILTPTRTYTAKRGDTVAGIARRFGLKKGALFANNPSLSGQEKLYDGQLLALKYGDTQLGMASSNGYFYNGCSEEKLCRALPYLTYVTVAAAVSDGGKLQRLFDDRRTVSRIKSEGKIPMLRVYKRECERAYSEEEEDAYINALIDMARENGYSGLTLSCPSQKSNLGKYEAFILKLRKRLIGCDLILFTEASATRNSSYSDYADGCILSYEKMYMEKIPSFAEGEKRAFERFASDSESSKTFIDISPFAVAGGEFIDYKDAVKIAAKTGAEITSDGESGACSFTYRNKNKEAVRVVFEALENIKAKLELLGELGYMGISFDIMRTPIEHLMMYNALYSGVCYTSLFSTVR